MREGEKSTGRELLREAERVLSEAGVRTPRLDVEVLLASVLRVDRGGLYARLRDPVDGTAASRFAALLERRRQREPVAYLTGRQEFRSLDFHVDPRVLIPRPETELLVEMALRLLHQRKTPRVCEIGTGSGCIAVSIAHARRDATLIATDVRGDALEVARQNARQHDDGERIHFLAADALAAFRIRTDFDLIVSNPPYVAEDEPVDPEVRHEPASALFAGADGLNVIRRIVFAAPALLAAQGALLVEVGGAVQAHAALALAREAGFALVGVRNDLEERPRVLVASGRKRPNSAA